MKQRTALLDTEYVVSQLRVIGIEDMFDALVVIAPAPLAEKLERIYEEKGQVLYPWPPGAEHRCIVYRVRLEPVGGYFAPNSPDTLDRKRAIKEAADKLREALRLSKDDSFLGAGI